jgi:hypothetical protein
VGQEEEDDDDDDDDEDDEDDIFRHIKRPKMIMGDD